MPKRGGWPHIDEPVALGRRLKEARREAGLSQRELSFPGCTAVYICRIERGDRVPSLQVLRELARRLGVDEGYLATGVSGGPLDQLLEAEVALRLDQLEVAAPLYDQAMESAASPAIVGAALGGLGRIDLRAGRVKEAVERLAEARSLLKDDVLEHLPLLVALAEAHSLLGDRESAIAVLEDALERARARNDEHAVDQLSILLAQVLVEAGKGPAARELLRRSIEGAAAFASPAGRAERYWSRSRRSAAEQDGRAATRYARMALAAADIAEDTEHAAHAHQLLAGLELDRGNAEEALELIDGGRTLLARAGLPEVEGGFQVDRARALAALGRSQEAAAAALAVVEWADRVGEREPEEAVRAYATAAEIAAAGGDRRRAIELYELAAELASAGRPDLARTTYSRMAELYEAEGRKDEALELLKRAVALGVTEHSEA